MNLKKITIFGALLTLLILGCYSLVNFYDSKNKITGMTAQENWNGIEEVKQYMEDCLKTVTEDGLMEMGKHGGYISPKDYLSTSFSDVGYAYHDGQKTFKGIGDWEEELSNYVETNLKEKCELTQFKESFEITESDDVKAEAIFGNEITIKVSWPITLKKDDKVFNLKEYEKKLDVRMEKIWEIMNNIIKDYPQTDLTYIDTLENVKISVYPYEGSQRVYAIMDHESKMKDKNYYIFVFATKE